MKKTLFYAVTFLLCFSGACAAKYVKPEDTGTPATRLAKADMELCDVDKDGFLTLDEFKRKGSRQLTRTERRNEREAKKKRYYKTAEEMFKEIDTEGEGKITVNQLEAYYTSLRAKGELLY